MREIPDPGFAGDTGEPDEAVRLALQAYAADGRSVGVLAALQGTRLVVPVVAVLTEAGHGAAGLTVDKSADMAAVLMTGRDGRRALLAFTGTASLTTWDPAARPVPVTVRQAARAARDEGADALLIDVAGPVRFVVQGDDLVRLAAGDRLVRVNDAYAWWGADQPDP